VLGGTLALLFIVLVITYVAGGRGNVTVTETVVGESVSPLMSWTQKAVSGTRDFFARLFGLRDIDKEYNDLKALVAQYELESQWTQELIRENERLTTLLGFTKKYPQYTYMYASVIGWDPNSWYSTITINRGSDQGIEVNMAVVTKDGLLGRVTQVFSDHSTVMTIIDRQSAVAAVLERSRDNGVLKGATDQESAEPLCNLYYLSFGADLVPGDRVLTSGMGGYYPKGIPLGEVVEVSRQSNLQSYAVVSPYVDFTHLEEVLIITGEVKKAEETQEPAAGEQDGNAEDEKEQEGGT
jgi:rod shape-determining protein MreC